MESLTAAAAAADDGFPLPLLGFLAALVVFIAGWVTGRKVYVPRSIAASEQAEADKSALIEERARRRAIRLCDLEDAKRDLPKPPHR